MKIAISSDEYFPIIEELIADVKQRGHEVIYLGPSKDEKAQDWPEVTLQAIAEIRSGNAKEGIVLCWTGTGCTLIANKIPGIRAALCVDAETARGARKWNHANVLGLSLRTTSAPVLKEILNAWFDTPFTSDEWNLQQMKRIEEVERAYLQSH
ncbi:MAG: RpiB/LacA/LacB family sugar-phosphate isomerase [Verrucomicrobia bacterium]|nr:RpiB/LacA/LacB family sugar-phosphate isomerase [Verrucomicrobiota bacterium]